MSIWWYILPVCYFWGVIWSWWIMFYRHEKLPFKTKKGLILNFALGGPFIWVVAIFVLLVGWLGRNHNEVD